MAGAVVGAAVGTSVDVLLEKLLSFPMEEIGLFWNLNKDLDKLKQSVLIIRDFLDDADLKKLPDKSVNRWLKKLEAVAFDADFVFDQLNYEVLRKKVEADDKLNKRVMMVFDCPNLKSIAYYPSGGGGQLSSQGGFTSLRIFEMSFCDSVTNLPIQMIESCTSSLERLMLNGSKSITNLTRVMSILPQMPRLTLLGIALIPKSNDVATEIVSVRSLTSLGIGGSSDCRDYVSFKASLDRIFPALQYSLRELFLFGMEQWDALPDQLLHLTTLQVLRLFEFGIEALPDWLGKLSSLTVLGLINLPKLRCLPSKDAMHGLTKLTEIDIQNCPLLKQNLQREEASDDDSEWPKISHIPTIKLDGNLISVPAQ